MRIAIFISGNGSNLQAIIDAKQNKQLDIDITGVISNKADAYGLTRAKEANIATLALAGKKRETFEKMALEQLNDWQVDCLVLAGFMRVLSADFIDAFEGIIINIHPSLLPKYKGLDTHNRVLASDDKYHGCSVHFVTPDLDSGKVIAQAMLEIQDDNADDLAKRVQVMEHKLLPRVIGWIADQRFYLANNVLYLDMIPLDKPLKFFDL